MTADGVAMVTGAAGGIGAAVVARLGTRFRAVAAVDLDGDGLAVLEKEAAAEGRPCAGYRADVSRSEEIDEVVGSVERELGPIVALVNAAGILRHARVEDTSDEEWERVLAVNTAGVFRASRSVAARMRRRGSGAIVTVASNAGHTPRIGLASYAASKAAAITLSKCLGLELAAHGVRVNVVAPGSTDTAMLRQLCGVGGPDPQSTAADAAATSIRGDPDAFRLGIPDGRIATRDDVAHAVDFLLSKQAAHITMQTLTVDGGATLGT